MHIYEYLFRSFEYIMFGMVMEVVFSAVSGFFDGHVGKDDRYLKGQTYLWMIPVYGLLLPFVFEPIYFHIEHANIVVRYVMWSMWFTAFEYLSGMFYDKVIGFCPWDYSNSKWRIHPRGYSKWSLMPLWGIAGLVIEKFADLLIKVTPCVMSNFS